MECLLIVKNYTGDSLDFGWAAEKAKSEGSKVETIIVGDDCPLPPPSGRAGRRGLAGTILVHKVAGVAAAAGLSLALLSKQNMHQKWENGTCLGIASRFEVCHLVFEIRTAHGEPGAAVADILPVDVVVSHVLNQMLSPETNFVPITRGNRVVLMING